MASATRYRLAAALVALAAGAVVVQQTHGAEPSFANITQSSGTSGPTERGRTGGHGFMFADADADGRPDLYITMIFDDPMPELFYRNQGGGRFAEEGRQRGIADFVLHRSKPVPCRRRLAAKARPTRISMATATST